MKKDLSPREFEVLKCAADGMESSETGELLGLSDATVKSHRQRLARKLGSEGKGMQYAVALAYRRGIFVAYPPYQPHKLTKRQMQILIDIASGLANKEIGVHQHITEDTVKTHVRRLLVKMNAINRTHLVGIAFRTGTLILIPPHMDKTQPDGREQKDG